MIEQVQGLIPGLPDDVAADCIARIPHRFHPRIRPVCKGWRDLVAAPSFIRRRERVGAAEDLIFLVQAAAGQDANVACDVKEEAAAVANFRPPVYTLSIYNATLATWHRVATPDAVPMFAQCTVVGGELILVGGWDPMTLEPVTDVRILDLATMTWRRGRPMASARSFFACAAVGGRVYVAGGHDGQKNALRSAGAYDVASDEWVSLPPMSEERDESRGLCVGGKFWAASGYGTESQGRFSTSAEIYDPEGNGWTTVEGVWGEATCAPCFVPGWEGTGLMSVDSRGVMELDGREWRGAGPAAPEGTRSVTCGVAIGEGKGFMVTGGEGGGGMWMVDLKGRKWVRVEQPVGFSGFVYSACTVRI